MSEKAKERLAAITGAAMLGVILWVGFVYGTSAEVWNAGEHTAGCDGTQNCDCYERAR